MPLFCNVRTAAAMVRPLDPRHHRDTQLLTGRPGATVQDVLLEETEERFHRRVISAGADPAHRTDHAMSVQSVQEFLAAKLRAPVRMHDAPRDITAHAYSVLKSLDGES